MSPHQPDLKLVCDKYYTIHDILSLDIISSINQSFEDCKRGVSLVIFLKGCNLRCNYCYNIEIAKGQQLMKNSELYEYLDIDYNYIDCIVLSGGEPLFSDLGRLNKLIMFFKERNPNIFIKLDTNGTMPIRLDYVLKNFNIDAISMDIKRFPLYKYSEILPRRYNRSIQLIVNNIMKSIEILQQFIDKLNYIEFRTTILPNMDKDEPKNIEKFIKKLFEKYYGKKVTYETKPFLEI